MFFRTVHQQANQFHRHHRVAVPEAVLDVRHLRDKSGMLAFVMVEAGIVGGLQGGFFGDEVGLGVSFWNGTCLFSGRIMLEGEDKIGYHARSE